MRKKSDIAIINTMPFPSGHASVNRILSYSKGLVETGSFVKVFSTACGSDLETHQFNGIYFKALRRFSRNRIVNLLSLPLATARLFIELALKRHQFKSVIIITNNIFLIYIAYFISALRGMKYISEKSEYPFVHSRLPVIGRLIHWFFLNFTFRLFDAMLIMTYPVYDFF